MVFGGAISKNGGPFVLKSVSLILLLELVYVCRRITVSGRAMKCERYEEQVVANSDSW